MTVSTRLECADDEPFLRRLIIATIAEELMASLWPEAIRENLLDMQVRARRNSIRLNYPQGESRIVLVDGADAGWFFVSTRADDTPHDEIRLVEIMLLPEHRGKGVGSGLIRDLSSKASRAHLPLRLSVDVRNAGAFRLYERLGFRRVGGDETRHFMEVAPADRGQTEY
jgi:ribosomal protein S18 acetylase RimI-like enzyme